MLSILEIAIAKGAKRDEDGAINGGEFERLGLAMISGCQSCHASLGPWNAYPTTTGYIGCGDCTPQEMGFDTVEAFDGHCDRRESCQG